MSAGATTTPLSLRLSLLPPSFTAPVVPTARPHAQGPGASLPEEPKCHPQHRPRDLSLGLRAPCTCSWAPRAGGSSEGGQCLCNDSRGSRCGQPRRGWTRTAQQPRARSVRAVGRAAQGLVWGRTCALMAAPWGPRVCHQTTTSSSSILLWSCEASAARLLVLSPPQEEMPTSHKPSKGNGMSYG